MSLLSVAGICYQEEGKTALRDIRITQEPFEKIAIAGETGSGKTTLLKIIAGLLQPTAGLVKLNDQVIKGPMEQLLPGNRNIAYLSQHFELRNNYRVHEILDMANRLKQAEAEKIYKICRIEHLTQRWTDELSGGERQRIALARLLSMSPKLLLLDEPFSNLDPLHKALMKTVLAEACEQMMITSILVSHDAGDILSWADTVILLRDGTVVQRGNVFEIYNRPVNPYCAGLLGAYNLVQIPGEKRKLFARPETITLTARADSNTNGIVQNVLFWGSYFTTDVLFRDQLIRVQSSTASFKPGENVSVSFAPVDTWYM